MKIAILGSGDVGQVLGAELAVLGYQVKMGTRDPMNERVHVWVGKTGHGVSAATFAETAAFGEMAIIATRWEGTGNALALAGADNLAGKVVIDAVNPIDFSGVRPRLLVGGEDSAGERIQALLPQSRVVKAFNIIGSQHMIKPDFPGGPPDMFICGNDDSAKAVVATLLEDCGWPSVDLGGIDNARYLEAMAMVLIAHAMRTGNSNHALKILSWPAVGYPSG